MLTYAKIDGWSTGGESIGFFLIAEFNDAENAILDKVLAVFKEYSKIKEYKPVLLTELTFPDLTIFSEQLKVEINGRTVFFNHKEFDALCFLAKHPCCVFSKSQIYEAVWEEVPVNVDNKVMCLVSSIRKKLREHTTREYIQTVWGVGYKFDPGT